MLPPSKSLQDLIHLFQEQLTIFSGHQKSLTKTNSSTLSKTFIQKITLDSRACEPHTLFCALKGARQDGHDFIPEAIKQHCAAIICEKVPENFSDFYLETSLIPIIIFPQLKENLGTLANQLYPLKPNLRLIGVTGTNGKTSVTHFIAQALNSLNSLHQSCGIIGTLSGTLTTPNRFELGQQLSTLPPLVTMEVSSHALDQNRVENLPFEMAIFTNLSHDHLDYHKTIEAYAKAKSKLFSWPNLKYAVINQDDAYTDFFKKSLSPKATCLTYSLTQNTADIYLIQPAQLNSRQCYELQIQTPLGKIFTELSLWGEFNISNALATVGALIHLGYSKESIEKILPNLIAPKGRMEKILLPNQATAVIDYAHTPDALEKVLLTLEKYIQNPAQNSAKKLTRQLICVFGCGGDRDRLKRPKMAEIAEKYASFIIITEDNSRFENPDQIFQDILTGLSSYKNQENKNYINKSNNYKIIPSRKLAIQAAVQLANPGDIILLAGKGHETYLDIQGEKIPFDERDFLT